MACELHPGGCRREHIAPHLTAVEPDGEDFEAHCPCCGHGGFRISKARVRSLRHIWYCNCGRCKCPPGTLRGALLRLGIMPACLGIYDGAVARSIPTEVARAMDIAIGDILAVPGLKPSDMRLVLAEARGQKVPTDFRAFVKFARGVGIGKTQAQEAASRWCRPSGSPSLLGEGVGLTPSRSTEGIEVVKCPSSEDQDRSVSDQRPVGFRPTDKSDTRTSEAMGGQNAPDARWSVSGQQTPGDKPGATFKPAA